MYQILVAELSPDELKAIIAKLDEVCRQAQELQEQLRQKMLERARRDLSASSAVTMKQRSRKKR